MEISQEIQKIMQKTEKLEVKDFTFSLVSTVAMEFFLSGKGIDKETVEACKEAVEHSLEIMNPEFTIDISILEELLETLQKYKEND